MIHLQLQTPNPDSQPSTFSRIGDFPFGKSTMVMLRFTYTAKRRTPNSDDTCTPPILMAPLCHFTPPLVRLGIAESQFHYPGPLYLKTSNTETSILQIRATCPCHDQLSLVTREITIHDFDGHATHLVERRTLNLRSPMDFNPLRLRLQVNSRIAPP
jgi:hypothetical protein